MLNFLQGVQNVAKLAKNIFHTLLNEFTKTKFGFKDQLFWNSQENNFEGKPFYYVAPKCRFLLKSTCPN